MINFSAISKNPVLKNIPGIFFKLLPPNIIVFILQGKLKGKKWIKSSGVNGYWLGTYEIEKQKLFEKIVIGVGATVVVGMVVGIVLFLTSFITLWAWNTLMPYAFNLPTINFWQAFAFNLLASTFRNTITTKK